MAATVYTPGNETSREPGADQYARDHFGVQSGANLDANGFPATKSGTSPYPPPLTSLLHVSIDPTWYAVNRMRWNSPLGDKLPVTFLALDDGITEVSSVEYADTQVIGRAEVYKSYMGTGNREISLLFQFRAQGISGVNLKQTIEKEVIAPARWLDALKYPVIVGALSIAPPPVILVLGELLVLRCIATAVSLRWGPQFDPATMLPLSADVEVTFTAVHESLGEYAFEGPRRIHAFQPPTGLFTGEASASAASAASAVQA